MVNLSVCIEMYWPDLPFDERIRRTAQLGFEAYEFWGWKSKDLASIRASQEESGIKLAAVALEPGFAVVNTDNEKEIVQGVADTADAIRPLGCSMIIVTTGNVIAGESYEITRRRVVRKLRKMAAIAADNGVRLCLEPLNPHVDHKGYWLTTMAQAADIIEEVDSPALTILYDLYHQQISEGNLIANLHRYHHLIGHIHTAGVPGRHELVGGENDYGVLFRAIDAVGYKGYVGLEFRPTIGEEAALRQSLALAHDA
jgi:hydroxypyruvate isomerase